MKKVAVALSATTAYLTLAPLALADTNINLCPRTGTFHALCNWNTGNIPNIVSAVITLLFGIALLVALVYLIYGGFKWITSGGDKGAVSAAREHIIAAVVGLLIVLLSYFILNFVLGFMGIGSIGNVIFPTI